MQDISGDRLEENRESALEREIRVKDALIHEVHHRVKNNLQTQVEGMAIPPQLNFMINYSFQNRGGGMGMP